MSSAVTPSDSACHPSDACRSRYSSGRSWTGLSPPLPPLVRSKPRFHPSVPPLLVAPPQYTLNHRSAVVREPWCPPVPGFPAASFSEPCAFGLLFPALPRLGKLDFPLMYRHFPQLACVASAPHAFRISRKHSACPQTTWSRRALATTASTQTSFIWVLSTLLTLRLMCLFAHSTDEELV
ncbi:hypothetical protein PGT21_032763 [Puccinia graminis f. sp. tritici]|uniref:Uncharacterized protein n=1 Tax=Puccinia graminis f. sp. tritici TaxID=56615 RepID=A0A5B0M6E5_PUCGR|nr:hypothetical protein PGT21_032763 [Puccinia graminis f. sp. tritici]